MSGAPSRTAGLSGFEPVRTVTDRVVTSLMSMTNVGRREPSYNQMRGSVTGSPWVGAFDV